MKKLQNILFKLNYIFIFLLFCILATSLIFIFSRVTLESFGTQRLGILRQVAERSKIITKAADSMAQQMYVDFSPLLLTQNLDEKSLKTKADAVLTDANNYFNSIDIDLNASIVMRDGLRYNYQGNPIDINKQITNNYWYLSNLYNSRNKYWIMRFGNTEYKTNCIMSCVTVIRDSSNNFRGVIMLNASERSFYSIYSDIIDSNNEVFILDEQGFVISHANRDLIGTQLYYMPSFLEKYKDRQYFFNFDKNSVTSVFHDEDTKWTYVQNSVLTAAFKQYIPIFIIFAIAFIILLIIAFIMSLYISKRISRPLNRLSANMAGVSEAHFELINIDDISLKQSYTEVYTITTVYNNMVGEIQKLIEHIKKSEEEKRQSELDFLRGQINLHFLQNTLLSIKCSIEMGQHDKANAMLDKMMKIFKIPFMKDDALVPLQDEFDYLNNYIDLMNFRYGGQINFAYYVEDGLDNIKIPRMLLQPIVENSIYHGFSTSEENGSIEIYVYSEESILLIEIKDDGQGLDTGQVELINKALKELKSITELHLSIKTDSLERNSVGLSNIQKRIKSIYGEDYGLVLNSIKGEGTAVTLNLRLDVDKDATRDTL